MPTATARQGPSVQERIDDLSAAHQATRHITLPPLVGGGVVALACLLHFAPTWLAVLVWIGGAVLTITGYDHAARLQGRRERLWALGCVTALAGGGAYWTLVGPLSGPLLGIQLFATAVVAIPLALPWTWHRRVRKGVQVTNRIRAFSRDTLDQVGLKDVDAPLNTGEVTGEHTWEIDLVPRGAGWTLPKMQRCVPALAAWLGLPEGKVTVVKKPGRKGKPFRGRLLVDESEGAPVAVSITLPEKPTDIRARYRKGELTGGGTLWGEWWREDHGAVGGVSGGSLGGGKTGDREIDAMQLVTASNALDPWIYDGKPGSPNWAQWGPRDDGLPALADWYTTEAEGFKAMVQACWAIAETRGGSSEHEPTDDDPFVGIICDESAIVFSPTELEVTATFKDRRAAERFAEAIVQATREYVQVYRSTGTALRLSTVRPEHKSVGDATIRSFLQGGECAGFITSNPRDGEFLFAGREVPLHTIPQNEPGTGFFKNFQHPEPARGRTDFFDHKKVKKGHPDNDVERLRRWKAEHPESSPQLPERALAAIRAKVGDAYDRRMGSPRVTSSRPEGVRWPRCGCGAEQTDADMAVGACLACGHELTEGEAQILAVAVLTNQDRDVDAQRAGDTPHGQDDDAGEGGDEPAERPGGPPKVEPAPLRYESLAHARQHCLDALRSLGDGWHKAAAVREVLGEHKAQGTVTNRLAELARRGAVERRGARDKTEWRALRATVDEPTAGAEGEA